MTTFLLPPRRLGAPRCHADGCIDACPGPDFYISGQPTNGCDVVLHILFIFSSKSSVDRRIRIRIKCAGQRFVASYTLLLTRAASPDSWQYRFVARVHDH